MERKRTEPYLSTWLHSRGGQLGLPIGGNFELTARCNFNCPMCYVHLSEEEVEKAGRELTAAQWIDIAREARDAGMLFALLTGGEPFVRKDFFEIYGAMKEMGLMVSINSNGSMLSGEIREKLIENPPFRINISLYGGCNETYQNMCGQPSFDKVVENIRQLKAAGIDVRLNLSITPHNCQDLEKIYEIAKELNVHVKAASYMYPSIRVNGMKYGCGNRFTPEEAAEYSILWDKIRFEPEVFAQRAEAISRFEALEADDCSADVDEGVQCRAGSSAFWMTWDGRMLPCGMMPGPTEYPLKDGFVNAWNKIREKTRAIRTPSECTKCAKRDVCNVCAAVCIAETGRFDGVPEYVCRKTDCLVSMMSQECKAGKEEIDEN